MPDTESADFKNTIIKHNLYKQLNATPDTQATPIDLSWCDLYEIKDADLVEMFTALQDVQVTSLDLSHNDLYVNINGLIQLVATLTNPNFESIDLSDNDLGSINLERLIELFTAFTNTHFKSIDLTNNDLYEGLPIALTMLQHSCVKSIALRGNKLYKLKIEEFSQTITALQNTPVKSIDWRGNKLYRLGAEGFHQMVTALKNTSLESIGLANNELYRFGVEGLMQFLIALTNTNVTSVDLSDNGLNNFDGLRQSIVNQEVPVSLKRKTLIVILSDDQRVNLRDLYLENLASAQSSSKFFTLKESEKHGDSEHSNSSTTFSPGNR